MNFHTNKIKMGAILETNEQQFSERNLLFGILWEGDAQLHTNKPAMEGTSFGTTIVHGNSVVSIVLGQLFHHFFGEASRISITEMKVCFVGAVMVGDYIKGIFNIEEHKIHANNLEILTMAFNIVKNTHIVVQKGNILIEIQWIK